MSQNKKELYKQLKQKILKKKQLKNKDLLLHLDLQINNNKRKV